MIICEINKRIFCFFFHTTKLKIKVTGLFYVKCGGQTRHVMLCYVCNTFFISSFDVAIFQKKCVDDLAWLPCHRREKKIAWMNAVLLQICHPEKNWWGFKTAFYVRKLSTELQHKRNI